MQKKKNSKRGYNRDYYLRNQTELQRKSRDRHHADPEKASARASNYYQKNREEIIKRTSEYAQAHKEERKVIVRRWHLKTMFSWTIEQYEAMFEKQNRACAICKCEESGGKGWHIDHDHSCCPGRKSCGKCIRGILCQKCNAAIGLVNDRIEILLNAVRYLCPTMAI